MTNKCPQMSEPPQLQLKIHPFPTKKFACFQGCILNHPFLKTGMFGQTPLKRNLEILLKGSSSQSTK